ncbi:hypothetical protein [Paraburkholderia caledonica]|jgi:hypothetical protein|uniref:hypothetical protein n=1 Tax=Paraburkholderia caledonica TaxID=134536 RepID=UPI001470076D|nr:hypothetical protein [Paraburkholderia caledonica]
MGLHHEFEFVADKHLAQTCAAGSGDEGGFAGIQFSVLLVAGLLALFLPGWRLENGDYSGIFIYRSFRRLCFFRLAVKWKNVSIFAESRSHTAFGVNWRFVET